MNASMKPIRLRVISVASHANVTRGSVAVDTSDTESRMQYCDFVNIDRGLTLRLVNLVVDGAELANCLAQHDGKLNLGHILELKMKPTAR